MQCPYCHQHVRLYQIRSLTRCPKCQGETRLTAPFFTGKAMAYFVPSFAVALLVLGTDRAAYCLSIGAAVAGLFTVNLQKRPGEAQRKINN